MISVITPVYNGESFIEGCIKVVIEQNCSDVEHIIVDGGSQDQTVQIIKQYAEKYPHIRWISESDQGQSDAMNKGIKMAKGEVIGFLNVDDFYEPNVLNRVLKISKDFPKIDLFVANCNILGDQDKLLSVQRPSKLSLYDFLRPSQSNPIPANPSSYFYHKSLHNKVGLYEIGDHYSMDTDFLLRAIKVANPRYFDEIWGNFRYVVGTKSFDNNMAGNFQQGRQKLLNTYKKTLPLLPRTCLYVERNVLPKISYFLRHPQDLLPSLYQKIKIR